jgi:hypothetical protein
VRAGAIGGFEGWAAHPCSSVVRVCSTVPVHKIGKITDAAVPGQS